ncbi:MAG: cyclic peptide export ABC transporter [Nitrospiraceae bacterium]
MNIRKFLSFLLRGSKPRLALLIVAGILSGFCSAGLLAVMNTLLHETGGAPRALALAFVGLAILKIVTSGLSQLWLVYFAQDTILDLGLKLCASIANAPFRILEKKGQAHIFATLTDDVSSLAWALQSVPSLVINGAILAGCAVYLTWLSWKLFVMVLVLTMVGAATYKVLYDRAFTVIHAARDRRSLLFHHFRSLTEGIKELMVHKRRREAFLSEEIGPAALTFRDLNLAATKQYLVADGWTQVLFYGLIGAVLLIFPEYLALPTETLTGYVFAMLYMMGPMWGVLGTLPTLVRGQVALDTIDALGLSLDSAEHAPASPVASTSVLRSDVGLELESIVFRYHDGPQDEHNQFVLGPLDFHLRPGELVFVVGGNGSGKSTLVKVLTGLYRPQAGTLRVNGQVITDSNREWLRELISVVFSDFYLFEKLLGLDSAHMNERATNYLRRLEIAHKVHLIGERLSTTDLSQGQRRRMALLTAYLEDRPFYIFDEWAADQDPQYKEVFYKELLPELRAGGKGVAVITHDDRYFHLGDRIVKLNDGKIVESWSGSSYRDRVLRSVQNA